MVTMWVIAGAGRGVGKTRLAQDLCEILPRAVYAKLGCSRPKKTKPPNYFTSAKALDVFIQSRVKKDDHLVVEANRTALLERADMAIYIDAVSGRTSVRPDRDQLMDHAHIHIRSGIPVRRWRRTLLGKGVDQPLCDKVCELFDQQKKFLSRSRLEVRTKLWFVMGDGLTFGSGLAVLLDQIDRCGSLSDAARRARISYRHAWNLIKTAETNLGAPLICSSVGGAGGGCSTLSDQGRRLLDLFDRLNHEVAAYADRQFAARLDGMQAGATGGTHDSAR